MKSPLLETEKRAISLLDQQFYPIVLTDWMMPEMDGPELCRNIRDRKMDGYVFIILITARDSKTDIVSGLESGADDYLTKPIHSAELLARINTGIRIPQIGAIASQRKRRDSPAFDYGPP